MDEIIFGVVREVEDDKKRVLVLIDDIEKLLKQIISSDECDFIFYKELIDPMKDAWKKVSERFNDLKNNTINTNIEILSNHGLTGSEIHFKISVINHAGKQFYNYLSERAYPLANRWLKKLLEALDKFLISLFDAVGGSGAIGEYKSFMESSIDDGIWIY